MNRSAYVISATLVLLFFVGMFIFVLQTDGVQIHENVSYGTRERNILDLYIPANVDKDAEQGVILFIHGGSWTSGDKSSMTDDCKAFAEKGYITATMNYSFLNFADESKSDFATMLTEIAAALNKIKSYAAEQGINITKAALSGYSAGAHLSMLYAYSMLDKSPLPILFVRSKAGPADYRTFSPSSPDLQEILARMGNGNITAAAMQSEQFIAMMQAVSPVTYVRNGVPPTLMAYGKQDTLVTWANAVSLTNAFEGSGVKYTLVEYPNSGHALDKDAASEQLCNKTMEDYAVKYFGY